jgi:hypothetical protein
MGGVRSALEKSIKSDAGSVTLIFDGGAKWRATISLRQKLNASTNFEPASVNATVDDRVSSCSFRFVSLSVLRQLVFNSLQ